MPRGITLWQTPTSATILDTSVTLSHACPQQQLEIPEQKSIDTVILT